MKLSFHSFCQKIITAPWSLNHENIFIYSRIKIDDQMQNKSVRCKCKMGVTVSLNLIKPQSPPATLPCMHSPKISLYNCITKVQI